MFVFCFGGYGVGFDLVMFRGGLECGDGVEVGYEEFRGLEYFVETRFFVLV